MGELSAIGDGGVDNDFVVFELLSGLRDKGKDKFIDNNEVDVDCTIVAIFCCLLSSVACCCCRSSVVESSGVDLLSFHHGFNNLLEIGLVDLVLLMLLIFCLTLLRLYCS